MRDKLINSVATKAISQLNFMSRDVNSIDFFTAMLLDRQLPNFNRLAKLITCASYGGITALSFLWLRFNIDLYI